MSLLTVNFTQQDKFAKCMMRADAINSYVYPVIMEMTGTKQIPRSHIVSTDQRKSEEFLVDKVLSQVYSTGEEESKSIIADESYTEERESECVHKK